MAGTTWTTFSISTTVSAVAMNNNFDWLEGHLAPMLGGSTTTGVYDLGTTTARFHDLFVGSWVMNSATVSGFNTTNFVFSDAVAQVRMGGIRGNGGTSTVREIATGTIASPDFRSNAASIVTTTVLGTSAGGTTITSQAITTLGGTVMINACATIFLNAVSGAADVALCVERGATLITGGIVEKRLARQYTNTLYLDLHLIVLDTPPTGTSSYQLRVMTFTGASATAVTWNLNLMELRA